MEDLFNEQGDICLSSFNWNPEDAEAPEEIVTLFEGKPEEDIPEGVFGDFWKELRNVNPDVLKDHGSSIIDRLKELMTKTDEVAYFQQDLFNLPPRNTS